jgi:hypothetical protein
MLPPQVPAAAYCVILEKKKRKDKTRKDKKRKEKKTPTIVIN